MSDTLTIRPDSVNPVSETNTITLGNGGSLSDDNDLSGRQTTSSNGRAKYTLADPALPAGAAIQSLVLRVRACMSDSGSDLQLTGRIYRSDGTTVIASAAATISGTTFSGFTLVTASVPGELATETSGYFVEWEKTGSYDGRGLKISEVYLDIIYDLRLGMVV